MPADDADELRQAVRAAYSGAASQPEGAHPFPVGREFAQAIGYSAELLAGVPDASVDAFTGVSNVSVYAELAVGDTVLDLGCGAGLDSLIASRRLGDAGRVIGVDFSLSMLRRAHISAQIMAACHTGFLLADAERLPLTDHSIGVALVNGIFNLNPLRAALFGELARVLRPGGKVFGAELILREPAQGAGVANRANWFA